MTSPTHRESHAWGNVAIVTCHSDEAHHFPFWVNVCIRADTITLFWRADFIKTVFPSYCVTVFVNVFIANMGIVISNMAMKSKWSLCYLNHDVHTKWVLFFFLTFLCNSFLTYNQLLISTDIDIGPPNYILECSANDPITLFEIVFTKIITK